MSEVKLLTLEEKATNAETWAHIDRVRQFLGSVVRSLIERGELHDRSKLGPPEVQLFTEYTPKLSGCTYGSEEYKSFLRELRPALDHHYQHNRHHPEFHPNGVNDMTLIDLIEMLCDWKAASERHNDGDIYKSIEHNTERFGLSPQLAGILRHTAAKLWTPDLWHCFGCGAGGMSGNFCSMCGAGRNDYKKQTNDTTD